MNPRPKSLSEFGPALAHLRQNRPVHPYALTRREFSNRCSVSESKVVAWEDGTAYPTPDEFAKIKFQLRPIRAFRPLLEHYWRSRKDAVLQKQIENLDEDDEPMNSMGEELAVAAAVAANPPIAEPAKKPSPRAAPQGQERPWPNGHPRDAKTFGEALRLARQHEDLSEAELAEIVEVSTKSVRQWEDAVFMPVVEMRNRLLDLFPVLIQSPTSNGGGESRHIAKPTGGHAPLAECETIGQAIRAARMDLGMTVFECAWKIGVSAGQVLRWENGKTNPSKESFQKLITVMPQLQQALGKPEKEEASLGELGRRYALAMAARAEAERLAKQAGEAIHDASARAAQIRSEADAEAKRIIENAEASARAAAGVVSSARAAEAQAQKDLAAAAGAASNN